MSNYHKYIGQSFNKWTILGIVESKMYSDGKLHPFCQAKCECGVVKNVNIANIIQGLSKNCGCVGKAKTIARSTKHGFATRKNWAKEHKIWCGLFKRCYDKNSVAYSRYGGSGVIVCERWHDFKNFITDMGMLPEGKTSIDRFPNKNGNYEPNNCRWADDYEQSRNRINNVNVTLDGVVMTAREAERKLGLPRDRIQSRLKRGMSEHDAINLPPKYIRK